MLFVSQVDVDGVVICVTLVIVHFRFLLSYISKVFAGTRFVCLSMLNLMKCFTPESDFNCKSPQERFLCSFPVLIPKNASMNVWRRGSLMVSALDSGASALGSSPSLKLFSVYTTTS